MRCSKDMIITHGDGQERTLNYLAQVVLGGAGQDLCSVTRCVLLLKTGQLFKCKCKCAQVVIVAPDCSVDTTQKFVMSPFLIPVAEAS